MENGILIISSLHSRIYTQGIGIPMTKAPTAAPKIEQSHITPTSKISPNRVSPPARNTPTIKVVLMDCPTT